MWLLRLQTQKRQPFRCLLPRNYVWASFGSQKEEKERGMWRWCLCFSSKIMRIIDSEPRNRGNGVALVVEALRNNPEGRGFDGIIGIFHWNHLSGRTMALWSTQPLTELSTKNISWARRSDLTTFMCRLSWNIAASTSWSLQGLYRDCFIFYLFEPSNRHHTSGS